MTKTVSASAPASKTLILHVGDHKTGSTTIQNAFAAHRVRLKGRKLLYPGNLNHNYLREHMSALDRTGKDKAGKQGQPNVARLRQMIEQTDADFILLSGESFEGFDPAALKALLQQHFAPLVREIRIIAYVRPHASRLLSTYAEQCKIGWYSGSLDAFFAKASKRFAYHPRLAAWRSQFGNGFIVRPMIRDELRNGDILEDFIVSAFGDGEYDVQPVRASNESLGLEDLVMLRHVQSHLKKIGKGAKLGLGWDFAAHAGALPSPRAQTRLQLHRALTERIQQSYEADAQKIDAAFFDNRGLFVQALDQAVSAALPEPQSLAPCDYFSPEELRNMSVLAETLCSLLMAPKTNWASLFRQRRVDAIRTQ